MHALESRVTTLTREKESALGALSRSRRENTELEAAIAEQSQDGIARDPVDDRPQAEHYQIPYPTWGGLRTGYQGFPFGQREGGFYYGAYIAHRLVDHSDGIPAGDLDIEVGAGLGYSGNDQVFVNSPIAGGPNKVEFRQRMISFWPALRYDSLALRDYGFIPYVTGGPGVWVDIIQTPPLVGGLQFPTTQLAGRKLPIIASAGVYEGAQGGAGLEYDLARTRVPILERMHLGFDYRYSAWTTGQRFSTYSMLLTYRR